MYSFDIAFNIAINQIVYTVTFIYAIISPMIGLLGATYFCIKYVIDITLLENTSRLKMMIWEL